MKRFLLFFVLFWLLLVLPSRAEDRVAEDFAALEDILPSDIAALLPSGFFELEGENGGAGVREASRFSFLFGIIKESIGLYLGDAISMFASLTGLILIGAVLSRFGDVFRSGGLRSAFSLCLGCAMVSCVLSLGGRHMQAVELFFDRMSLLVNGMIPLTGALYAMGGNVSAAVVNNAGMMMFLNLLENFCVIAMRAAVGICTALTVCSAFVPNLRLSAIGNFVKRIYTFFLGFLMLLLSFSLSVQTALSSAADSVAMRSAKMLAGTAIPVVGGTVGDSLKTVAAGISFLRTGVGLGGVILLLLLLLPTLVSVILYRLSFIAAGACAELLGCDREQRLLSGFVTIYGYLLATVAICSVCFVFLLTLFVRCGVALGG